MNIYPIVQFDIDRQIDIDIDINIEILKEINRINIKRIRKFLKQTLCFLFFVTLSQRIHTLVTLVSLSHNLSHLLLLDRVTSRNSQPNCEHVPNCQ